MKSFANNTKALKYRAFFCWVVSKSDPIDPYFTNSDSWTVKRLPYFLDEKEVILLLTQWRTESAKLIIELDESQLNDVSGKTALLICKRLFLSSTSLAENYKTLELLVDDGKITAHSPNQSDSLSFNYDRINSIKAWSELGHYAQNPVSKWFTRLFRLYGVFLLFPFLFVYVSLGEIDFERTHVKQKEKIILNEEKCSLEVNATLTSVRRLYQAKLFKSGIHMLRDKDLTKVLVDESAKNGLDFNDPKDWNTKVNWCIMNKGFEKYSEEDKEAWGYFLNLTNDSLSYPTDYFWNGALTLHRKHEGIDIGAKEGSRLKSPMNGIVQIVEGGPGGRMIGVRKDSLYVFYAHCDKFLVFPGDSVKVGEPIATVGMTGRTTGPHVHIGTAVERQNKKEWINPLEWYERYFKIK